MPVPSRPRLLPGAPRWTLAVVLLLAATVVAEVANERAAGQAGPPPSLLALALHGGVCVMLVWRARTMPQERAVWERLAAGAVVFSAAAVATTVLGLFPATRDVAALPMTWAPVLAFPLVYGGLVRWNRFGTNLADPNDVLNGSSAVLAMTAVLNTVLTAAGSRLLDGPWWQVQGLLAQVATAGVLVGTSLSVIGLGGMRRDPRGWLVAGAFALALIGHVGAVAQGGVPSGWPAAAFALGVCSLAVAAAMRPARVDPQPTDPTASTVGAFVVILASTAVLGVDSGLDGAGAATWCAALAAIGSSVRLLVNVRELAQLAVSRREALTDELTGLANRRAVLRRIDELCEEGSSLSFALLDLDKFKEVNDGLGHSAGDELLRLVAARLRPVLRPGDLLGRLGGDEFAVVAPTEIGAASEDAAAALGRRLVAHLGEPFRVGGMSVHVAASIGLASSGGRFPAEGAGAPELLLRWADAAMYDAKRSGTGVAVYDSTRHADSSTHLGLVEQLRTGIRTGELVLHHQPQVDVATGVPLGVEALVRWAHPVRGLLGPTEFLPLAEVHGLMGLVTDEVLRQAVAQASAWWHGGRRLRMSVNLSASNLLDTDLPHRVSGLLLDHALPPEALVLEVTESVLISDPDRSLAVVARLADLGVTVSIDDFGTGYSSLSYLRELPVGELKLDRSFTSGLLTDTRTEAIVASTITLAHRLGLRVVAEGVEHGDTLAQLAVLGCDDSQGYLHSPPLPADRLERWLDQVRSPALQAAGVPART
ncbi:EAL domain-containing protein [Geodermatophilus sabuli]|uniref:EAL domain-containing protein n=1 Tax=Geodermatophilus sabuli TaxID=1564158 RepID=A0A7K3W6M7_9ACTN|nr:EAL domain-containing protein [Geodermatophilus sabuli]NEK60482.1 EAL domain-containing protein [Geodermatophilus sabuli]